MNCIGLKNITLSNSIISIGNAVFMGCNQLKKVFVNCEKDNCDYIIKYFKLLCPQIQIKFI